MKLTENNTFSFRQMNGSVIAFILITACFAIWGFANSVTNSMVGAFSKIFRMSTGEATLVPVVYYLGYFCMAFPAALYIKRYSFRAGVILGLIIYAVGALLFIPANAIAIFSPFLGAYFIMTGGLSFLEVTCHPYVYCMGKRETGIIRLNAAQAFNSLGSVAGMLFGMMVHSLFSPVSANIREQLPLKEFNIIKNHDLNILIQPYIFIGAIAIVMIVVLWLNRNKLPEYDTADTKKDVITIMKELLTLKNYREGIFAEFCYIGAQAGCWTYTLLYGTRIFIAEGMSEQAAEVLSQKYNIIAMVFFACSRFICTWLMQWFSPARMLSTMGILGMSALLGVICFTDRSGLYCLVAVSICLSLMYPTIYGLALNGVGNNIKMAGAGLTTAILGGSFFLPIQGLIIQSNVTLFGLPSTNLSYVITLLCLVAVVWYAHRAYVRHSIPGIAE